MNYEKYFVCIDPGSEYSGCVVLGVNDDAHIPDILWVSSRKEGAGESTKTGKKRKGLTKYNHKNEELWAEALHPIVCGDMNYVQKEIVTLIEKPESRMAIFDSNTIQATFWTGRFFEHALLWLNNFVCAKKSLVRAICPSEVRHLITGTRGSNPEEVYIKTREFFDDPDKYEGIKSHARSALNLYVAYQKMRVEVPHV